MILNAINNVIGMLWETLSWVTINKKNNFCLEITWKLLLSTHNRGLPTPRLVLMPGDSNQKIFANEMDWHSLNWFCRKRGGECVASEINVPPRNNNCLGRRRHWRRTALATDGIGDGRHWRRTALATDGIGDGQHWQRTALATACTP